MKIDDVKITPKWNKSKDEIWNNIFSKLEENNIPKIKNNYYKQYAAVATILILITTGIFSYSYKTTKQIGRASHLEITLPDNSKVKLNADSKLSYKPYWWFFSRNVELSGEAFFEVMPGKQFTVKSLNNEVKVLGTSFNIFARAKNYNVTCITGKVEVKTQSEKIILTPNMQVESRNKKIQISRNIDAKQSISWTIDKFSFVGVPLINVVQEIERQYDITISSNSKLNHLYTGNFSKETKPEEVLKIIGKPFGITFKIEP